MRLSAEVGRRRAGRTLLALFMVAASALSLWAGVAGLKSGVAPAPFRHMAPIPRAAHPVEYWLAELLCLSVSPFLLLSWSRGLSAEVRADRSPTLTALDTPDPGPTVTKEQQGQAQAWMLIITGFVMVDTIFFMTYDTARRSLTPSALDVGGWGAALLLLGGTLLCYGFQLMARSPQPGEAPPPAPRPPLRAPWPPLFGLIFLLCGLGGADQFGHHPDAARVAVIPAGVTTALSALGWWFWPARRR